MATKAPMDAVQLAPCRQRFPALQAAPVHGIDVFADNSSRSQMPDVTLAAIHEQLVAGETHRGGQPDWDSPRAAQMAALRDRARDVAAQFCGGQASQIGFAANGTSTLAILARALFPGVLGPGDTVVITEADHESNRSPWQSLAGLGCHIVDVPVAPDGSLDRRAWEAALALRPKVVALCMISNVTGVVLPHERLAREAHAAGSIVVLDAVQGPPHGVVDVMSHGADVAIFSNCKLFSPHLGWWAATEAVLDRMGLVPAVGSHPDLEWGTLPHAAYAGFVATHGYFLGLSPSGLLSESMDTVRGHEASLTRRFLAQLPASFRDSLLAAETSHARVPIFSLALPRSQWARVRSAFTAARIDVRIGQFGTPATLKRLARWADDTALRLSFVHYNSPEDVDAVCEVLASIQASRA